MENNADLRKLTLDELQNKLLELRKTQFKLRLERANGVLEKTHRITVARKLIARVKTIMSEKVVKS